MLCGPGRQLPCLAQFPPDERHHLLLWDGTLLHTAELFICLHGHIIQYASALSPLPVFLAMERVGEGRKEERREGDGREGRGGQTWT